MSLAHKFYVANKDLDGDGDGDRWMDRWMDGGGGGDYMVIIIVMTKLVVCEQCPMPQLMVTPAAAADNTDAKHLVHSSRPPCSNLDRRSSTPAVSPLSLRPPAAIGRLAPGVSDLPSKPRLDSLFNTHGDIAKFRQLLRESTDETMSEERVNYCCDVTTTRIEAWLRSVRAARLTAGGLCRQTADASLESERAIKLLQNNDKKSDMNPTTDY